MTASDHAQQRPQRFPLPERGRPQMGSGPPGRRGRAWIETKQPLNLKAEGVSPFASASATGPTGELSGDRARRRPLSDRDAAPGTTRGRYKAGLATPCPEVKAPERSNPEELGSRRRRRGSPRLLGDPPCTEGQTGFVSPGRTVGRPSAIRRKTGRGLHDRGYGRGSHRRPRCRPAPPLQQ